MKRRGFFGAFAGLIAAPVAAVAIDEADVIFGKPGELLERSPRELLDVDKFLPEEGYYAINYSYQSFATAVAPVSVNSSYEARHNIVHCNYCGGREFSDYTNCRHCGASM